MIGDPRNGRTGSYYIRPFGAPVIESFFAGEGACIVSESGLATGFAMAIDQLVGLFGADVRRNLRPLIGSAWRRMNRIGGAYSYALPGHADARAALAYPFDDRLFFAGEATHPRLLDRAWGPRQRCAGGGGSDRCSASRALDASSKETFARLGWRRRL